MAKVGANHRERTIRAMVCLCITVLWLSACNGTQSRATFTPTSSPAVDLALFPSTPTEIPILLQPTSTTEPTEIPESGDQSSASDIMVFSLAENGHDHLFAYQPMQLPYTRLTSGEFDDRDPSTNPDGTRIAFSSNRNGFWDIYVLDLVTQNIARITSSNQYDGAPKWSPDGQWLTYESYNGKNLNVVIQSVSDPTVAAIQLTENAGNNYTPVWSPAGREVAFVTDRSGQCEIWTARLDTAENRFTRIVGADTVDFTSPAWSPDGSQLAWIRTEDGASHIQISGVESNFQEVRTIADGSFASWSPDGKALLILFSQPNSAYISAVSMDTGLLIYSSQKLPGEIHGMDWNNSAAIMPYLNANADTAALYIDSALWQSSISAAGPNGRYGLVELQDVDAPYPYLQDAADEAFNALRSQTGAVLGWDFLASLDDATLPVSSAPQPGISENWLFTGRAIAVNSVPLQADWLTVSREDFNGKTYWRLWVKCLNQDGSCGEPQRISTWDFSARYSGDFQSYEDGGVVNGIPAGYWVDFTSLAARFGWERIPAESIWRSYFSGTLFNQFVLRQGLTWDQAMLEVYPEQALPVLTVTAQP